MKKLLLKLYVLLSLSSIGRPMAPSEFINPVNRYKKAFNEATFSIFGNGDQVSKIHSLIFQYSLILVSIYHEIPIDCPNLPRETRITYELPHTFCVIDLKYLFAKLLEIPTQSFRLTLGKTKNKHPNLEANPLALVADKAPWPKTVLVALGKPVLPIKHRSCPSCLHTIVYYNKSKIVPNRFEHIQGCPYKND